MVFQDALEFSWKACR